MAAKREMAKLKSKVRASMKPKPKGAEAIHVQAGDDHVVGLKALRVLLCPDGAGWYAQGLEIDYAATGSTMEETKENFEAGLAKTIAENVRMHGSIQKMLKVAPQDVWSEYLTAPPSAIKAEYSSVTAFKCRR